jgi:hypothetical protein
MVTVISPKESEIREALVESFSSSTDNCVTWVSELGIAGGRVRADLVRLESKIEAFEIKSRSDSLKRLAHQAWYYGKAFDEVSLVADSKHIPLAMEILPRWWGIWEVGQGIPVRLNLMRKATKNPSQDGLCLASLLSRSELQKVLHQMVVHIDVQNSSQQELWSLANKHLSFSELRSGVLGMLASRISVANAVPA